MTIEIMSEIRFGSKAYYGIPPGIIFDHVRFPKLNMIGPKNISWPIELWRISLPGTGLRILLSKAHFCAQYMKKKPNIAKSGMMGWIETKKHVNKKVFTT